MASPPARTVPGSPQGYINQVRRHRPDANHRTRLACFLLNHLQENLVPLAECNTNFFKVRFRTHYHLYRHGISHLSQPATLMGLESLLELRAIQVNIKVHKYIGDGKNYLIEAIAEGHAPPENDQLEKVVSCGGKKRSSAVCIGWKVIDGQFGSSIDDICWNDVLALMRKAIKKA
ncbi:hypothetical protein N431DRAFT_525753 [Stipitochalara longipes BDJ]|nr:hypothetical protein N431DRAFT_525753 [Stipitochalara longipes BDJ]